MTEGRSATANRGSRAQILRVARHLHRNRGSIMKKAIVGVALCVASVVGVGAGSALAGEATGNQNCNSEGPPAPCRTPIKYRQGDIPASECAFSGLEDGPSNAGPGIPGETQTPRYAPGQVVRSACGGWGNGNSDKGD